MVESFAGTDITMADEIGEDGNHLNEGADLTMEDKANNIINGGTDTTRMFSFLGKKLWKRKKYKGKISPSSSRMMRTISIHHLECTDFVSQSEVGETASDGESSKNALSFDSSAMRERESEVIKATHESAKGKHGGEFRGIYAAVDLPGSHERLKGKLIEVRDALLKLKDVNLKGMSNEFANRSKLLLDTLELFNANREAVLDAPEDLNYSSPEYVERLQVPIKATMLTKSASFPGSEFSGSAAGIFLPSYRKMKRVSIVTHGTKPESVSLGFNNLGFGSGSEVSPVSHELRKRREAETVLNRLRNLKERIKDVILENRKEKKRICRDRILHKVPFGHKLLEDMRGKWPNLWDGSASERCDRGSEGGNFNNAPPGSCSKFAHLFETVSLNEKEEVPESSKSMRKDNGLFQGKLPKGLGRILSSPVLRSYSFGEAVRSEGSLESFKNLVAEPFGRKMGRFARSNSIQEDNGLQQENLTKNFGRTSSIPVFGSYSFSEAVQILKPESLGIVMEENVDKPNKDATISPILEKNDCENEMVVDPDPLFIAEEGMTEIESQVCVDDSEYIEASPFTEVVEEEADSVNRHEDETAESDINTAKPSFISSLDLNMVEGFANSAKYLLREASELPPTPVNSDEPHQLSDSQNKMISNEQNFAEHSVTGYADDEERMATSLLIHVDRKYDILFEFVRRILSKSGYGAHLSPHEFVADKNKSFEQSVLYDLINEALVEIYEQSTAPNPWLLHFHSRIRSMPVGIYLLKDVWTKIRWHLCAPQGMDATLEDLMAHDFGKDDGWMNLHREAERVALQLEYLIMDDLLDEAVVDSDKFDF